MYKNSKKARKALRKEFEDEAVEILVEALVPAIAFKPAKKAGDGALGQTRFGGTPDLPANISWPIRAVPDNTDEILAIGGSNHEEHLRDHLISALPYEFAAQIDLKEAAHLGEVAKDLPNDGRLLFFFDGTTAPWWDGTQSCAVIHDQSDLASLQRAPMPLALVELNDKYVAEMINAHKNLNKDFEDSAPLPTIKELIPANYWGPTRPMKLKTTYRLPERSTHEALANEQLQKAFAQDEEFADAYFELISDYFWDDDHNRQQLLGPPVPEQDDPRYDAVIVSEFGCQHLSFEEHQEKWPLISEKSKAWHLLFQLDMSDFRQDDMVEGTYYFLIHKEQLKASDFSKTVLVYQQT